MPEITIPKRLMERLTLNTDWLSCVTALQSKVQTIIKDSPYFFPDYTDHGIDHINEVLTLTDRLIPADTYGAMVAEKEYLLDPISVGFLICAILIHDIGMFLKTDGMEQLVQGERSTNHVEDLDETDWTASWSNYVAKARRMNDNEKIHQFGRPVSISKDCILKGSSTTEDDRRIIGEFLRQNHGRLAHEIACHGFPGSRSEDLFEHAKLSANDLDMIGLLARSHCMNIRDTEEYLKRFNEGPRPHNIPAFYLMAVLRMADYLDASEKRAPEILERIQKIRVPASEKEWCWNQCISKGPKQWDLNKHNLMIHASPTKSTEYVLLDHWLRNVQAELDLCWSILADQYSGEAYRLTIHRVCSNIHQKTPRATFEKSFLTKEVKVTANPKIVELMMDPLYGKNPTYGVRELLQNAVDACVERKEWEDQHGNPDYKGLVDIRIEHKIHMENGKPVVYPVFTITDNGMGMNENILLNYYLSAGSSYRDSENWKAANAPDNVSLVARTGKFGVGFLAAFLLGDSIKVHTQHRDDKTGYQFKFDQRSMPLDVKRDERTNPYARKKDGKPDPTGTTITIKLKREAIDGFRSNDGPHWYNWYAFDEPRVEYRMYDRQIHHKNLSLSRDPGNPGWLKLDTKDYETYLWRPNMETEKPEFYCNGIRIYGGYEGSLDVEGLNVYVPHVSLIDKDARLDVDLARKELKSIPEEEALFREVLRWHIARLLLTPWDTEQACRKNLTLGFDLRHNYSWGRIPFLLSSGGFTLNYAPVLSVLPPEEYVILYYEGPDAGAAIQTARDFLNGVPCSIVASDALGAAFSADHRTSPYYYSSPAAFARDLLTDHARLYESLATRYLANAYTAAVWLREDTWNANMEDSRDPLPLTDASRADGIRTARFRDRDSAMPIFRDRFPIKEFPVAVHVIPDYLDWNLHRYANSLFIRTLKEVLTPSEDYDPNDIWIPFKMDDREKKFPEAFEKLKDYIEHIRLEQEQEARHKAEEAAKEAQKAAKFKAFQSDRASDITEFQNLLSQADPETLPQAFFSFLSQFVAAVLLDRPFLSIPEESVQELSELFRALLDLDDEEEITPDILGADPEEIAEFLFELCEDMDWENLAEDAEDNMDAAAILSLLTILKATLPEA